MSVDGGSQTAATTKCQQSHVPLRLRFGWAPDCAPTWGQNKPLSTITRGGRLLGAKNQSRNRQVAKLSHGAVTVATVTTS